MANIKKGKQNLGHLFGEIAASSNAGNIENSRNSGQIKGRFVKGNPGKPRGAKNSSTRFKESLSDGILELCLDKLEAKIKAGEWEAIKFALERLYPLPKPICYLKPGSINLSKINLDSIEDLNKAFNESFTAFLSGDLASEHMREIQEHLTQKKNFIEVCVLAKRVQEIEDNYN